MLIERNPGDLVVVVEHGVETFVELGAICGERKKTKKAGRLPNEVDHTFALVTTIDRDSFLPDHSTWRAMSASTEVVAVIATLTFMRALRMTGRTRTYEQGNEVDPLLGHNAGPF